MSDDIQASGRRISRRMVNEFIRRKYKLLHLASAKYGASREASENDAFFRTRSIPPNWDRISRFRAVRAELGSAARPAVAMGDNVALVIGRDKKQTGGTFLGLINYEET